MTERISFKQKISDYLAEERWKTKNRLPRWFFFSVGEKGYYPTMKEFIYRSVFKLVIFIMYILFIIWIILIGINTPIFIMIQNLSTILHLNELIWIAYGTVFGMAGSLIFQNIKPGQSIPTYLIETFIYILYFAVFFLVLNFILWILYIMY